MTPKEKQLMAERKAKREYEKSNREYLDRKSRGFITRLNNMLDDDWIVPALDQHGNIIEGKTGPVIVNRTAEMTGKANIMMGLLRKTLPDARSSERVSESREDRLDSVLGEIAERPVFENKAERPKNDEQEKAPESVSLPGPESVN